MADGLVRVRLTIGGKAETIKVSAHHVEAYLASHPGAVALDDDWREQAVRVQRVETRAPSEKDK
jgi:hypothetical protein